MRAGRELEDGGDRVWVATLAGRVEDEGVGLRIDVREDVLDLAFVVLDVRGAGDVHHRVVDGGGGLLDGDDLPDERGEDDSEGANAGVGVEEHVVGPSARRSRTRATSRSVCGVLVWKNEAAEMRKRWPRISSW